MDHEVGPWKMVFFNGPSSWSNFHGLTSLKNYLLAFGPSQGVNQMWTKKNDHAPRVNVHAQKGQFLKQIQV